MRRSAFFICGWLLSALTGFGQISAVTTFDGTGPTTSPFFDVQDKWQVEWICPDLLSVTLFAPDGSVVASTSCTGNGTLFLTKGGRYYLQVVRAAADPTTPWHISVEQVGPGAAGGATNSIAVMAITPLAISARAADSTTNAAPASSAPVNLTEDQAHAIVVIKGDVAEGTGFLVHTPDGPAVVTNLHVISANPNVKIYTTSGAVVKTLSLKGASDRDLAMFMVQDDHYTYLDLNPDIKDTVEEGDDVITPGNSEGGEVVLDTKGRVIGIGPERIEVSNPIYHGNSGGPVIHIKSGKVLSVITMAQKVKPTDDLDKASFANTNSAIVGTMRYYSLRLDTVPQWEPYDWNRFLNETTFLKNFHDQSRCLDSFMNGASYEKAHVAVSDENGPPNSQYYVRNEKLQTAHDNYHRLATDADDSQKLDASREMVMDLEGVADADMDAIQNVNNFYAFDQLRAAQEIKYRKALRTEVENFGNKISDQGH